MSYFLPDNLIRMSDTIKINGVAMPDTSEPVHIKFNNISDGGRLAGGVDYEGTLIGVKENIELKYARLNKELYDLIFNATQKRYCDGLGFFMEITVPTYTALGIQTFRGYFQSTHEPNCVDTTEKYELGKEYWYGGSKYDELHENVVISFVQK